ICLLHDSYVAFFHHLGERIGVEQRDRHRQSSASSSCRLREQLKRASAIASISAISASDKPSYTLCHARSCASASADVSTSGSIASFTRCPSGSSTGWVGLNIPCS